LHLGLQGVIFPYRAGPARLPGRQTNHPRLEDIMTVGELISALESEDQDREVCICLAVHEDEISSKNKSDDQYLIPGIIWAVDVDDDLVFIFSMSREEDIPTRG
jgi:hypothetical protein